MPHDKNGELLKVGDKVTVECEITAVQTGEEYCNLSVKTVEPMHPSKDSTSLTLNAKQVIKCCLVLLGFLFTSGNVVRADDASEIRDLKKRVAELEKKLAAHNAHGPTVAPSTMPEVMRPSAGVVQSQRTYTLDSRGNLVEFGSGDCANGSCASPQQGVQREGIFQREGILKRIFRR